MISFSAVDFSFRHGWFRQTVRPVLIRVDWHVAAGESVALLGASGSGKTTIVKLALGVLRRDSGAIRINGIDPTDHDRGAAKALRRAIQWVPQHPDASFDPRMSMQSSLRETLAIHGIVRSEAKRRIATLLDRLALSGKFLTRRPRELSGGEIQRFAIARALLLDPKVLLLDEPTSMLDVSVQASIMRSLLDLRDERKLSLVLITHDRHLAGRCCDRIDELTNGQIAGTPL